LKKNLKIKNEGKVFIFVSFGPFSALTVHTYLRSCVVLELERAKHDPVARIKTFALETKDVLDTLNREYKPVETVEVAKLKADSVNAVRLRLIISLLIPQLSFRDYVLTQAHYSTGEVAASFTSTSMGVKTVHEAAIRDEDSVRYERVKKKGDFDLLGSNSPILTLVPTSNSRICETDDQCWSNEFRAVL